MQFSASVDKVLKLAQDSAKRCTPESMRWMWGQALYLYALARIDEQFSQDEYTPLLARYYDAHIARGYVIECSDTAAPGLGAYALYRKTGQEKYLKVAQDVVHYMKTTPKVLAHLPNHLGKSLVGRFYPKSIWVDSIMMYGVFSGRYAAEMHDEELSEFCKKQVPLFAKYLRDEQTGLFYHSYWVKRGIHYPTSPLFWGRGNGWVMAAMPMLLPNLPESPEKQQTIAVFQDLAKRLLLYQRPDGYFETLLFPNRGAGAARHVRTYKEASATALIAAGLLYGARTGLLGDDCKQAGLRAFEAVVADFSQDATGLHMRYISAPTIPVPLLPSLGYRLTPTGNDLTYGLAAIIFAALEASAL